MTVLKIDLFYINKFDKMVRPTFFIWEIIQKFFFLAWGFHILATRKIILWSRGPNGPLGGHFAHFRAKKVYFEQFSIKFHVFSFLRFFNHPKHYKRSYKHFLSKFEPSKLLKKGVKKLQNGNFHQKKGFPTKKSCKI